MRTPCERVTTDQLIACELQTGSYESAVQALGRAYGGRLYGFGLPRLGDHGLAEEVAQAVLTRVWRSAAVGTVRSRCFAAFKHLRLAFDEAGAR